MATGKQLATKRLTLLPSNHTGTNLEEGRNGKVTKFLTMVATEVPLPHC